MGMQYSFIELNVNVTNFLGQTSMEIECIILLISALFESINVFLKTIGKGLEGNLGYIIRKT